MALPWVRLDSQWPQNPKFLMLAEDKKWRAIVVYMGALGWSGVHGTSGFVPVVTLPFLHGTRKEAAELVDVGLWNLAQGGWDINGWEEFQPAPEDARKRRDKAQKAAQARWAKTEKTGDLRAL
jgi:hypothetical protein